MTGALSIEDYQTLLRILAQVPEPNYAQGEDSGLYLIDDGTEAQLVGDEVTYLNFIRIMLGVLRDTKMGALEHDYGVYQPSSPTGVFISHEIQGEINAWHSHVNLIAMYIVDNRQQMNRVGKLLGWYHDEP